MSGVPFDDPLRPYTFQLADYFTRGSEHVPHTEGVDHVSKMAEIRGIQQALRQMCLSSKTIEPPEAMIVTPPSTDRASVFSMCFPKEVPDYDLPMNLGDDIDGVTLPDTYMDEMGMIGTGRILNTAPRGLHSAFDMFGVSMINTDNVTLYDACTNTMDMIGTSRILDASSPRPRSVFDVFGISMLESGGLLLLILFMILFLLRERPTLWTYLILLMLCLGLSPALRTFMMLIMT